MVGTTRYFDPLYECEHGGDPKDGVDQGVRLRRSDLRCLVRTAFTLLRVLVPDVEEEDEVQVQTYWAEHLRPGTIWHDMMHVVDTMGLDGVDDAGVYDKLRTTMATV